MQLKNGSFSGERTKDVKGTQKHTEVLLVSWVPSAFLARRLASANTEKKKKKMPVSQINFQSVGPVRLLLFAVV